MVKLTIDIPDEVRKRAGARAILEGKTLADVIRTRLEEYAAGLEETSEELDAAAELAALEEAGKVSQAMIEHYGLRPEGWVAQAVREFREEFGG